MGGCDRPGTPSRAPGESAAPVLNVPYPVAEPERVEGAGRRSLADASFVFISTAGLDQASGEHALPQRVAFEAPLLVAHHVEPRGPATSTWQKLRRLGFGRVEPRRGQGVQVEAAEVEALGFAPPAAAVWLVGPRGTCQARVGDPVLGAYDGALDTVMIGYRLENCVGGPWAQVGIVASAIPVDFRWVPAEQSQEDTLAHGGAWDDPLEAQVGRPSWSAPPPPQWDLIRVREIPGAEPRVVQVFFAQLEALAGEDDRPWCELASAWSATDGWYNGRWIDRIPWSDDAVGPFMLGAFVNGPQVDAVIYDDRNDALVVVPPGPLGDVDDPSAWTQVFVSTGRYAADELKAWGYQPARGGVPVGGCEASRP